MSDPQTSSSSTSATAVGSTVAADLAISQVSSQAAALSEATTVTNDPPLAASDAPAGVATGGMIDRGGPRGGGKFGRFPGSPRGGRGDRDRNREEGGLEDRVVNGSIRRCSAVVKGGRRFSFSALVVVGDRSGNVGVGFGKANEVPPAVEKAKKDATKNVKRIVLQGKTIPHEVTGRYGASLIRLLPASPGTGVIAGSSARAVLELAGVQDVLTKSFGSTNVVNLVKATWDALQKLRSRESIEKLRGLSIEHMIKTG